jgi:Ras-related protein Rab-5C
MLTCKIMLLGDMGVGKTSIARQLVFGTFDGEYGSTIGVDIYTYDVEPPPAGAPFKFLVWDTDGSFGEALFNLVYIRQAQAALVVGDATRPATLDSAARLAENFLAAMPGRHLAVVLNKWDLVENVEAVLLPDILRAKDVSVVRTSAKTGLGVKDTFHEAAATIVRRGLA